MIKNLLFAGLATIVSVTVNAQCMDWVDPSPTEGYLSFGDVPCTGQSREITSFEVYKSEAYILASVQVGDNFTFSICNGPGAGTWVPEFTVVAPSGAVDAFGPGDGDGCSITWTASESGTYIVAINEAGNCGVAADIDGGYPKITTNSGGIACPEFLDGAESFESADLSLPACWQVVDADGDGFNWVITSDDGPGLDGDYVISSYSYTAEDGALTPDNYLITPQVVLGNNESLYYAVRALNSNYSEEEYSVYVSTTGNDIADFTDEVFADNLEYVNQWQARTVDLSAYAGQTIYLAFRHYGVEDLVGFSIDGVKLPGTVVCNPDAISDLDEVESIIFPNPTNDNLNITSSLEGAATIHVFDALGRVVLKNKVVLSQSTFTQNVSALESGMYTIQISSSYKVSTQHFVKQ